MTQTLQAQHPSSSLKGSSNQDVRNKFFSMIGIESNKLHHPHKVGFSVGSASEPSSDTASTEWVNPRSRRVSISEEKLKYNKSDDEFFSSKRRKTDPQSSPGGRVRKRLEFDETVKVVPIPMRNEYSNRVRTRLWSNAMELHENAARNSIEFAAEGWEWRTVAEDERMYVCVATGELIHPCHYEDDFKPDAMASHQLSTPSSDTHPAQSIESAQRLQE